MIKIHQLIRFIVFAEDEEEALEKGKDLLEGITGENRPFDYGSTIDEGGRASTWGYRKPVYRADSVLGKKLIREGMKYTMDTYKEKLEKVRQMINKFTPEELCEGERQKTDKEKVVDKITEQQQKDKDEKYDLSMFRYYCGCINEIEGHNAWIYDQDGQPIMKQRHLKDVLGKWDNKYNGEIFVVPCDVHS